MGNVSLSAKTKTERIIESTQRMRRDSQRLFDFLESLKDKQYDRSLDGYEERMRDIDHAIADVASISAYLSNLTLNLFSKEYPQSIFELTTISKSEFYNQVSSLSSFYKSISFLLLERSKTARSVWEHEIEKAKKIGE